MSNKESSGWEKAISNGISNWWNSEKIDENSGDPIRGGIVAMSQNARKYVISTAGRSSNILNIFDKTNRSSLGNPKWWVRFDRPHGNVNSHHININKSVTGLKDPHIQISPFTAKTAGVLGKVAETTNNAAPYLATSLMIYDAYQVGMEAKKDYDHGTTRNTIQSIANKAATYTSGGIGASAGAAIGSIALPGIGTYFGMIFGGIAGGNFLAPVCHVATEQALDKMEWDSVPAICRECKSEFLWKKYRDSDGGCCASCNKNIKSKL